VCVDSMIQREERERVDYIQRIIRENFDATVATLSHLPPDM